MRIREMEEGEGASSHDKEAEGQNIRVGNAETESNRHKGRGEQETLIETVRSLKIEVQSYKEDNERLMREKSSDKFPSVAELKSVAETNKEWLKARGRRQVS
jgi:FtsZ-binding cell division protein ZapB